jgi:hypothetical protein
MLKTDTDPSFRMFLIGMSSAVLLIMLIVTGVFLLPPPPPPKSTLGWKYRIEGNVRTAKGPHPTIAYVDSFRVEGDSISWENSNGTQLHISPIRIDTLR